MKDQEFELKECDFICAGPPHWFIKKRSLRLIRSDTPFSLLKKGELTLEDVEDEEVEYAEGVKETIKIQNEPLPMLKLTDRTGAFANFWLDYGVGSIDFHDLMFLCRGKKRWREGGKGICSKPILFSNRWALPTTTALWTKWGSLDFSARTGLENF